MKNKYRKKKLDIKIYSGIFFLYRGKELVYIGYGSDINSRLAILRKSYLEFDSCKYINYPKEGSSEYIFSLSKKLKPKFTSRGYLDEH